MGIRSLGNNRLLDSVNIFKATISTDEIGGEVEDMQFVCEAAAKITYLSGSRLEYFKKLGYAHPVEIEMYRDHFDELRIGETKVEIISIEELDENNLKIKVVGNIIDGKFNNDYR